MPNLQALLEAGLRELRLLEPLAAQVPAGPGRTQAMAAAVVLAALRGVVVLAALATLASL